MNIAIPQDFYKILNQKHLLLDTSFFIDAFAYPSDFGRLTNNMKSVGVTLVTLDAVVIEFIQGTPNLQKQKERQLFIKEFAETSLPITKDTFGNIKTLLKEYREDGTSVSMTDFLLAGMLVKHKRNLFLATKNLNDFPTNIFERATYFHLLHRKTIQSYGLYYYQ